MRHLLGITLLAVLVAPGTARGQVSLSVSAGALLSTPLAYDTIATPIEVRANPGPVVAATLSGQLATGTAAMVRVTAARARLVRDEDDATVRITSLTTWTPTVGISRHMGPAAVRLRMGVIIYDPSDPSGNLFREGSPAKPIAGLGIARAFPLGGLDAALELDYDVHAFSTTAQRSDGFTGEQTVHRFALTLTVGNGPIN